MNARDQRRGIHAYRAAGCHCHHRGINRTAPSRGQKAREAAQRTQMQNLLKAGGGVCIAFDSFFKKFGVYPSDLNDVRLLEAD
jgi:hypothetical protein